MGNTRFAGLALGIAAATANASITVYNNFASYNNAVGGVHTIFENFDGVTSTRDIDRNGFNDIPGFAFNERTFYSSPDAGSFADFVNIADIGGSIRNEIGPMGSWNGRLRWSYDTPFFATAFTGIELEPSAQVTFYSGQQQIGSILASGGSDTFRFVGFVSSVPFDRVEVNASRYAIDAHYSSIPAPGAAGVLAALGLAAARRRRA